jgi:uncharacterized damage-inducible protein DinB
MIDLATVQELFRYNRWANGRVFERLGTLPKEDFTRDLGNSYPSLRDTALHIIWAEWIWLERWKGTSPQLVFQVRDFPTVAALETKWSEVERGQRTFLDTLPAERLREVVPYVNLQGHTWRYPLWRQMVHVVNHSTYHRGQLTTMLRQVKAQVVATDFLIFHDELDVTDEK